MPRIDPARLTAWYDLQAPFYGLWRDAPTGPLVTLVGDRLADLVEAGPRRALDLGCGTGMFAVGLALRHPDWQVTGVDASAGMLRVAERSARRRGVGERVRFERGDAGRLAAPSAAFDVAVLSGLLPNLPDWDPALAEVRRVLRPGGLLTVVEVDREALGLASRLFFRAMIAGQRAIAALVPRFRFADRWDLEATTVAPAALLAALARAGFGPATVRRAHAHLIVTARAAPPGSS